MKRILIILLFINFTVQAQEKIKWPQHKKAVIVLTYDDALESQLNIAVPQLDAAHLTATFFLTGDINRLTIPRWRALSKRGYELGNHTIFHPCLSTDDNPVPSEKYTAYGMIREIEVMNHFLYAVDGQIGRTFAYPCAETLAGGKDYVDTLKKYDMVKYARIGGDTNAVITDFKHLDPFRVPSYGLEDGTTGNQLIAFVKSTLKHGGMGVIMFHGIGGDYITTSAKAHQELLNYIRDNQKDLWVTTFQKAMDYVTAASKPAAHSAKVQ
ncbi:polysaccharide deacetylase family protein [Mucilaginibacter sp. SP1R1]|uniref:polysaccharide deacetylase family protein n=1 Tax=Mucilaginibacter sp. SP1R1 TaxID=2723091 RepID=UPI001617EE9B|nr:polysaccharide deacetylase family protein [Mucilaginibacter sp. SP1R1]MBB6148442.1 peptidoglycan/xylan/chitin deacetylase (PgdA/CDA1 family) [Mucilaginibacter sp. SP1R1]